jgi:hypothetical protein
MVRPSPLTKIDFAISRFESWRPSQPQGSLPGDFEYSRKCRHFRRLAATHPVSGEEFWRIHDEGRESRGESLLDEFSISEIWMGAEQRPVAFPQRPVRIRNQSLGVGRRPAGPQHGAGDAAHCWNGGPVLAKQWARTRPHDAKGCAGADDRTRPRYRDPTVRRNGGACGS